MGPQERMDGRLLNGKRSGVCQNLYPHRYGFLFSIGTLEGLKLTFTLGEYVVLYSFILSKLCIEIAAERFSFRLPQ